MKDYTKMLEQELLRMRFDYDNLRVTSNFSGTHTCYQYHIEFKDQYQKHDLPENVGFTFQIQFPDDADFYIQSVTVDFVLKKRIQSAYRIVYYRKLTGFPTKDEMISRLLQRKQELDNDPI